MDGMLFVYQPCAYSLTRPTKDICGMQIATFVALAGATRFLVTASEANTHTMAFFGVLILLSCFVIFQLLADGVASGETLR